MMMFKLFDQTSEGYIPNNMIKTFHVKPDNNTTHSLTGGIDLYNAKDELLGVEWNYGTEFMIPFEIVGEVYDDSELEFVSLWDFLENRVIKVSFLDHFYNEELSFEATMDNLNFSDNGPVYELWINEAMSKKLHQGTHHIRLVLTDYNIDLYSPQDSVLCAR